MTRSSKDGNGVRTTNREEGRNGGEDAVERPSFASPPCFMHELDAAYLGYLDPNELTIRLGGLLGELRILAEVERRLSLPAGGADAETARAARERARQRVVETIRDLLPRTADDRIHRSLREMLAVYERWLGSE